MINYHSKLHSFADGNSHVHNQPEQFPKGERCFEPHIHTHLEFIFVMEGEYLFHCGDREEYYHAGDIFITNRDELHSGYCMYTKPQNSYRYLQLDLERLLEKLGPELRAQIDLDEIYENHVYAEGARRSGLWERGSCLLEVVLPRNKIDDVELLGNALLFLNALRSHRRIGEGASMKKNDFVGRVGDYVEQHYVERITVERIADALGYEKSYFCRKMRREFGKTFSHYLHSVRINKFCSHPALNLQNIAQCAQDVGYNDYAYFYQVFRRGYKMSPREYLLMRARKFIETER